MVNSSIVPDGVEIRQKLANVRQKNGDIYVYERRYYYDSSRHKNIDVGRTLLYKIVQGIKQDTRPKAPAGSRRVTSSEASSLQPPHEEAKDAFHAGKFRVGAIELCDFIGKQSGIDQALLDITDPGIAQKIISIARYWTCTAGHTLPLIQEWQLVHKLPYQGFISEDVYSNLFETIGLDSNMVQQYFRKRVEWTDCELVIAYDSSPISTYSENIGYATFGYDHDNGDQLPQISVIVLYSITNRQPIAYSRAAGNTPDVITVLNALIQLEALGVKVSRIITDCGYYSQDNVAEMLMRKMHFQTRVKINLSWVKKAIDDNYRKIGLPSSYVDDEQTVSGICIPLTQTHTWTCRKENQIQGHTVGDEVKLERKLNLIVLQDSVRKQKLDTSIRKLAKYLIERLNAGEAADKLSEPEKKFLHRYIRKTSTKDGYVYHMNNHAIQRACRYHGLTPFLLDNESNPVNCWNNMRLRERVEEGFGNLKGRIDGKNTRSKSENSYDGRLFVEFVTMGYEDWAHERIRLVKNHIQAFLQNPPEGTEEETKRVYRSLRQWLHDTSLERIMYWFDLKELTVIDRPDEKQSKIFSANTKRDNLFVQLFTDVKLGE